MTTQHTPGPWIAYNTADSADNRFKVGKFWPMNGTYQCVANCEYETTRGASSEEALANAHLIAAAPNMLEALEAAKTAIEELLVAKWGELVCFNDSASWCKIHAAIAKARGQA